MYIMLFLRQDTIDQMMKGKIMYQMGIVKLITSLLKKIATSSDINLSKKQS